MGKALPSLSVVIPTIAGREADLRATVAAYYRKTPVDIEWIIERDHPNCGAAWNAGARRATGEILHLGADDLMPSSDAWYPAALFVIGRGGVPLGWVHEDVVGRFGRDFCRVPTCCREWWRDVPEVHYYSDNAFTEVMAADGHPATIAEGYDFYHRRSLIGRDDTADRLLRDLEGWERWRLTHPST